MGRNVAQPTAVRYGPADMNSPATDKPTGAPAEQADFGFTEVPAEQKASLVGEVFTSVAGRYDVMNDLMSWRHPPCLEGPFRQSVAAIVR